MHALETIAVVYFAAGFARAMWTNQYSDAWWPFAHRTDREKISAQDECPTGADVD